METHLGAHCSVLLGWLDATRYKILKNVKKTKKQSQTAQQLVHLVRIRMFIIPQRENCNVPAVYKNTLKNTQTELQKSKKKHTRPNSHLSLFKNPDWFGHIVSGWKWLGWEIYKMDLHDFRIWFSVIHRPHRFGVTWWEGWVMRQASVASLRNFFFFFFTRSVKASTFPWWMKFPQKLSKKYQLFPSLVILEREKKFVSQRN